MKVSWSFQIPKFAVATIISILIAGCGPLNAKGLRESESSGQIAFKVKAPLEVLSGRLFNISTKCLYADGIIVTKGPGTVPDGSNVTFAYTETGYYIVVVTIDLTRVSDAETSVLIYYFPNITSRFKKLGEKARDWAVQTTDNCESDVPPKT